MRSNFAKVCFLAPILVLASRAQDGAALQNQTRDGHLAPLLANLGHLHVPITTKTPEAQRYFDQGMTLVYGFNHAEGLRSFREVARLDPDCAMAYWGEALALAPNINDPAIGPDREQQGYAAIREAVARKSHVTPREKALIDALATRFASSPPNGDRTGLNAAYAEAMTGVYKRFPKDPDVVSLYADAVMNTRPWNYWTKDSKPQPGIAEARAALEKTVKAYPKHAGANHMYIHLMEASDFVDLAEPSADRLGSLAPAAGHLVHMPGHIYIRVGRYADAAEANVKAVAADEDYITQCRAQGIYPAAYYPHNLHFLTAALVMDGRSAESIAAARKVASKHDHAALEDPSFAGIVNSLKALPMITLVRFGLWDDVLKEQEPPADQPFPIAVYHFGRGFAYSARNQRTEAQNELALLEKAAMDPKLQGMKILELNEVRALANIGVQMLKGELAEKAGQYDSAITEYAKAVEIEDNLLYDEPPDWLIPPRQYLAQAYLLAGKPADAERAYREDLRRHRNNGWSLRGLQEALAMEGKKAEADKVRAQFDRAWQRADIKLAHSRL